LSGDASLLFRGSRAGAVLLYDVCVNFAASVISLIREDIARMKVVRRVQPVSVV
jgi:hypothetical protein